MYGVTKTALFGLTKALAAEMVPNTRVNCIAPCFVLTNFPLFITSNEATRLQLEEKTLLGRLGTTEHMAAGAAFLASDDDAYTTGNSSHCWGNAIEAVAYVSFLVLIVCFCCWI
ncbi:hypothetical protein AAHE18_11G183700 [Arachis hypogaea]